jgi:shikimate dehydrogenase
MTSPADQYAVLGNPIEHSQSPQIHALFAAQTGQHLEYRAIRVEPGQFAATVNAFRAAGGCGVNITVPCKRDAWVYADRLSVRADRAGAVNTLVLRPNDAYGDNTDGIGLVRDLCDNHGYQLAGQRILLLGTGGAARGVLQPLLAAKPSHLFIANRTSAKAMDLALRFSDLGTVYGGGFDDLAGRRFELILNATAASLDDQVPPLPAGVLADDGWCYDLFYSDRPTAFVRWAQAQGAARALDGLGMLVEQAAEAFLLWRGVRPDTPAVIAKLRRM